MKNNTLNRRPRTANRRPRTANRRPRTANRRPRTARTPAAWVILVLVLSTLFLGVALAGEPEGAKTPVHMLPSADGPTRSAAPKVQRFIVQLEDAPLATYVGGVNGYVATAIQATGAKRLDVSTSASRAYIGYLQNKQSAFRAELAKALPGASVTTYVDGRGKHDLAYQVTFNGVVLTLPDASPHVLRTLAKMDGVKAVFPDARHELDMYASLPLIGAETLWNQVEGQANAGRGIKVASIDTGVYAPNPCFSPDNGTPGDPSDDFDYPVGFPKGEADFTNGKVIAARAYFRDWDPPLPGDDTPWPGANGSSHGTHTSGTMACNANTMANVVDAEETISGVAPGAWMMSYRIFYPSSGAFSGSAFTAEIVMAIEDAVADGADVINASFGGLPGTLPLADPLTMAFEGAWDAGVFAAKSAGNSGPGTNSISDGSDKIMLVGASTTSGTIAVGSISVTSPEPVPDELKDMPFGTCLFCPQPFGEVIEDEYVDVGTVTQEGTQTLCDSEPIVGDLTGKIALISRGGCFFSDKVWNAQQSGAIGAIIYNNQGDGLINMSQGSHEDEAFTIPAAFIGQGNGEGMVAFGEASPGATAAFDFRAQQVGNVPDVLASFSSRGPLVGHWLAPHVTVPGVNILSGGYAVGASGVDRHVGFGQVSGTSMAAPHVAGSAALLKQLYPSWTPSQIKSALMTTAQTTVWLDQDQTEPAGILDVGAGRIDLGLAGNPGLTFDFPSVSFVNVTAPWVGTKTIEAIEVAGISASYNLSTEADEGIIASTDLRGISVEPGSTASFELTVEVPEGTEPGDYTGYVWLEHGPHKAHIPFWVRVNAPKIGAAEVLLIDNDYSDLLDFPDYTYFYTSTLESLGVTYDYYNADLHFDSDPTLPPAAVLNQYEVVIFWTGDNYYPDGSFSVSTPLTEQDQWILMDYLDSGGRILATGQDLASATDINSGSDPTWDRSGMYHAYLGARYLQDSIFDPDLGDDEFPPPPAPSVAGVPASPFDGLTIDISGSTPITTTNEEGDVLIVGWEDGAGNQLFVDQIAAGGTLDDPVWEINMPLMVASGGYPVLDPAAGFVPPGPEGVIAVARGDEPTLEKLELRLDYRTLYLGFGFEAVNNDTGYTTREDLMRELLNWLTDEVAVTLGAETGAAYDLVTLNAEVTSSVGAGRNSVSPGVQYRWDFGDGSDIATTATPSVDHLYTSPGTYTVRVEATDAYGHKAVSDPIRLTIGEAIMAAPSATGHVVSTKLLENNFGGAPLYTGSDTRGRWPVTYHGAVQFDLAVIPADAHIIGSQVELTGLLDQFLGELVNGTWDLSLLDDTLDATWTSAGYWHISRADALAEIGAALADEELEVGSVNAFAFSPSELTLLADRVATTGRASFRLDSEVDRARRRHIFAWDGGRGTTGEGSVPVLRVTYFIHLQ